MCPAVATVSPNIQAGVHSTGKNAWNSRYTFSCLLYAVYTVFCVISNFAETFKVVICGKYKNLNKITKI